MEWMLALPFTLALPVCGLLLKKSLPDSVHGDTWQPVDRVSVQHPQHHGTDGTHRQKESNSWQTGLEMSREHRRTLGIPGSNPSRMVPGSINDIPELQSEKKQSEKQTRPDQTRTAQLNPTGR